MVDPAPAGESTEDRAARFGEQVAPLTRALYGQALRMTRNHADAEDLVQDALTKGFAAFGSFAPGSNLNAWLHRILVNTYISNYRKIQRRPAQCPTEEITDPQLAASAAHTATGLRSAEDHALENIGDQRVMAAMRALPEQFRATVYYADVEGLRFREIADLTNTPVGTVMSRLHRGRRHLRGLLAEVGRERGYRHAYGLAQTA